MNIPIKIKAVLAGSAMLLSATAVAADTRLSCKVEYLTQSSRNGLPLSPSNGGFHSSWELKINEARQDVELMSGTVPHSVQGAADDSTKASFTPDYITFCPQRTCGEKVDKGFVWESVSPVRINRRTGEITHRMVTQFTGGSLIRIEGVLSGSCSRTPEAQF